MFISFGDFEIEVKLYDTDTARKIKQIEQFTTKLNTWGEEVYFKTPLNHLKLEPNARDIVEFGELAYWTEGNSIAIGFGPTPASLNKEIRLVSKVNVWGEYQITDDLLFMFKKLKNGDTVSLLS